MKVLAVVLMMTVISCSHQGKMNSHLRVSMSSLGVPNLSAYARGGAVFYGVNNISGESFALNLINVKNQLDLELTNGPWTFAGILWNGNEHFVGEHFCATLSVDLQGAETELPLSFSKSQCVGQVFSTLSVSGNINEAFPKLDIKGCRALKGLGDYSSFECDHNKGNEGLVQSYQVKVKSFTKGLVLEPGSDITSRCYNVDNEGNAVTDMRLPAGNGVIPFSLEVVSFLTKDCSKRRGTHSSSYLYGLATPVHKQKVSTLFLSGHTHKLFHQVTADEVCKLKTLKSDFSFSSGDGSVARPFGLCSRDQWPALEKVLKVGQAHFELLKKF